MIKVYLNEIQEYDEVVYRKTEAAVKSFACKIGWKEWRPYQEHDKIYSKDQNQHQSVE